MRNLTELSLGGTEEKLGQRENIKEHNRNFSIKNYPSTSLTKNKTDIPINLEKFKGSLKHTLSIKKSSDLEKFSNLWLCFFLHLLNFTKTISAKLDIYSSNHHILCQSDIIIHDCKVI